MPKATKTMVPILRDRLLKLRGSKKQEDIAHEIGISRQSYGFYETGKREPDLNTLIKIARYFGVSTDYLLGIEQNTTHDKEFISQQTGLSEDAIKGIQSLWLTSISDIDVWSGIRLDSITKITEYWEGRRDLPEHVAEESIKNTYKSKQNSCIALRALNVLLSSHEGKNFLENLNAYLTFEYAPSEEEKKKTEEFNKRLGKNYRSVIKGKNGYVDSEYLNKAFLVSIQENLRDLKVSIISSNNSEE